MNSLFEHIDFYCERTGPELWSEPVNALTNLAFIAAGVWGLYAVGRRGSDAASEALCWWVVAIGIGSAIFHTFATELTKWADILPIAGFTLAYTLFCLLRFARMGWASALTLFFGFYIVAGVGTAMVPDWLRLATNGSTGYLPPFLALIFFGAVLLAKGHRAGWYNIVGALVFVGSVTCRMIDPMVCDSFPLGTHFMWHTLNGLMLGILLAAVARYGAETLESEASPARLAPGMR